jgi:hypothetical protein
MVAFFVRGYFSSPEGAIAFRLAVAARTAVPEAAVNKYGQSQFQKDKIRFSLKPVVSSPAGDA